MANRDYTKEGARRWQRFFRAREKRDLYEARAAAGLDPLSGMKVDEVVRLAALTVWLREVEYRSYVNPAASFLPQNFDDLNRVLSEWSIDSTDNASRGFVNGVNDLLEDLQHCRADWQRMLGS